MGLTLSILGKGNVQRLAPPFATRVFKGDLASSCWDDYRFMGPKDVRGSLLLQ